MLPLAVALTLAGLALLANAMLKLVHFSSFVDAVARYAPTARPYLVAVGWTASEALAAILLLTPLWFRAIPAAWLIAGATGGLARRASQGAAHDCGCTRRSKKISPAAVRNNLVLLALCLVAQAYWAGAASLGIALTGTLAVGAIAFLTVGSDRTTRRSRHRTFLQSAKARLD